MEASYNSRCPGEDRKRVVSAESVCLNDFCMSILTPGALLSVFYSRICYGYCMIFLFGAW